VLFNHWAILLLFLSIISVLRNREAAVYNATGGKEAGRRNYGFTVAYAILAIIIFVLGTAGPAVYVDTMRKFTTARNGIDLRLNPDGLVEIAEFSSLHGDIEYVFSSVVVLTGVVVVVSTIMLWRACRAAGVRDKITNNMLKVVTPVYLGYNLFTFVFPFLFLNISSTSAFMTLEITMLAHNFLSSTLYLAVAFTLLRMASNRTDWNIQGGAV